MQQQGRPMGRSSDSDGGSTVASTSTSAATTSAVGKRSFTWQRVPGDCGTPLQATEPPPFYHADDAPIKAEHVALLEMFQQRIRASSDAAYHDVLCNGALERAVDTQTLHSDFSTHAELTQVVRQAVTLAGDQPKQMLDYLEKHPCAIAMKENWKTVLGDAIDGTGFKIGTRKGRRAPDDKLYLQVMRCVSWYDVRLHTHSAESRPANEFAARIGVHARQRWSC
jgi:hypothetical protein